MHWLWLQVVVSGHKRSIMRRGIGISRIMLDLKVCRNISHLKCFPAPIFRNIDYDAIDALLQKEADSRALKTLRIQLEKYKAIINR